MKYRIVPIVIVVLIIFVGHILKRIHISKLRERLRYVFRITIPLDKVAADEGRGQKTLSEREQKIYNMICENLHLSVEQVMAELDISRATVFRDYAKIKKVTGAIYDKKTSTWTLD